MNGNDPSIFWDKVDRSGGPAACWPWVGRHCGKWGSVTWTIEGQRKTYTARSIAHYLVSGERFSNSNLQRLKSSCGSRNCCNPLHLFVGTRKHDFDPSEFWARVDRRSPQECWPWTGGARHGFGYGVVWWKIDGKLKTWGAHVVAKHLADGTLPRAKDGIVIRHSCDNPICANPGHLLEGTVAENNQDILERGRNLRGSKHPNAKLSEEIVASARQRHVDGESARSLAMQYGVDPTVMRAAISGKRWAHVQ